MGEKNRRKLTGDSQPAQAHQRAQAKLRSAAPEILLGESVQNRSRSFWPEPPGL
jgi:hypothetical protein